VSSSSSSSDQKVRVASFENQTAAAQFALPVFDATSRVRVSLYSRSASASSSSSSSGSRTSGSGSGSGSGNGSGSDRLLGETFCALADLADQRARNGWYVLIGGDDSSSASASSSASSSLQSASSSAEPAHLRPILRLQTQFVYSHAVDFFVACAAHAQTIGPASSSDSTAMGSGSGMF
jgi:hypothetical protein